VTGLDFLCFFLFLLSLPLGHVISTCFGTVQRGACNTPPACQLECCVGTNATALDVSMGGTAVL